MRFPLSFKMFNNFDIRGCISPHSPERQNQRGTDATVEGDRHDALKANLLKEQTHKYTG